jgi:hypothetical protein
MTSATNPRVRGLNRGQEKKREKKGLPAAPFQDPDEKLRQEGLL